MNRFKDLSIQEMIALAQHGDDIVQNYLLKTYQPFIAKCVSEVCKRYIDPDHDDEFSVGLTAFNDAIFSYSSEKGSSFFSFSKLVIKRRVIDYIRFIQKTPQAASLDEMYDADQMENPLEIKAAKETYFQEVEAWYRKEEIHDYQKKLKAYKMSLAELTKVSPKHKDARQSAVRIARILYNDIKLRAYVQDKKRMPVKALLEKVDVSKKTLERNRKYILAIFIVLSEDYVYLKEYIKGVGQ